jgi:nicotinamidase-related amidase
MQVGICSQIKSGSEIVTRISRLLAVARATGMRVAFTRHLSLPKAWMGATQFRMAMAWQQKDEPDAVAPWFLRDAPGFQIVSELSPMPDEAVFDKITMSAFEGTPLTLALRDCGILSVAIVGIATEIGIEPTARHAADLCFIPVVSLMLAVQVTRPRPRDLSRRFASQAMRLSVTPKRLPTC